MTPERPESAANDKDSAGTAPAATPPTSPPATRVRRTQAPGGGSGKHPLPSPWPRQTEPQPFPDAEDVTASPTVSSRSWLPEPEYWLADHQSIPRPPTRPIARPKRCRRMSRLQSALFAFVILIIVVALGAGMIEAGRLSYDFFNAPRPAPTTSPTAPAHATPTLPATQP